MESLAVFQAGLSRKKALQLFREKVKQSNTIFSTDHWLSPKLKQLRALLSDPITADQAQALDDVLHGRHEMRNLLDWLVSKPITWDGFFRYWEEREREARHERQEQHKRKLAETEAQRVALMGAPLSELAAQGGEYAFAGGVHVMVRGREMGRIPDTAKTYPTFLSWWLTVGRLNPENPSGWSQYSDNYRYRVRVELLGDQEFDSLDSNESDVLMRWLDRLPVDGGAHFNYTVEQLTRGPICPDSLAGRKISFIRHLFGRK